MRTPAGLAADAACRRTASSRAASGLGAEHAGDHFGRSFGSKESKDKTEHGNHASNLGRPARVTNEPLCRRGRGERTARCPDGCSALASGRVV